MSDEERQNLEPGAEATAANVPSVEGDPVENPEALESHLESMEDQPAPDDLSPVEPETAHEAQGEAYDPEAAELQVKAQNIGETEAEVETAVVDEAEAEGLVELADERAEAMADAPAPENQDGQDVPALAEPEAELAEEPVDDQTAEPEPEPEAEAEPEDAPADDQDAGGVVEPEAVEDEPAESLEEDEDQAEMALAEDDEEPAADVPDDDRLWYVIHCYSGQENKVRHNLEQRIDSMGMKDRIFDVVVPTEEEIEVKDGKRRTVERRVFPGYILVQMILSEDSWYVVRNTPGVTGFVGMGNEPTPLRPEEVSQIIKRMEAEAPRIKVTYKIGQKVRIIDGPFNDFIGTVDDIDMERAKVRVMVSFFGRETPVELDFLQVEKA
jgi:transcriptional antiterminator NusG